MTKTQIAIQIDEILKLWRKSEAYGNLSLMDHLKRYINKQPQVGSIDDNALKLGRFDELLTSLAEEVLR